jgi:hypothetical protein
MTIAPGRMDSHACARDVEGGEACLTKSPLASESEELLEVHAHQPRFLQSKASGPWYERFSKKALFVGQVLLFAVVVVQFIMLYRNYALAAAAAANLVDAGVLRRENASSGSSSASSNVPDYYVTKPLLLPGKHLSKMLSCSKH